MRTLLCCIAKNENKYIREFVEYYKKLGFTHICLYDNNDVDGEHFEDSISDYIGNFVGVVNYRGKSTCQLEAYNDCYKSLSKYFDWIAFFDCDEFLTLEQDKTIDEYLSRDMFKNAEMIHVNWMNYGDNDELKYKKGKILKRFKEPMNYETKCAYQFPENYHVKSIIRGGVTGINWNNNPHTPYVKGLACVDASGNECKSESPFRKFDYSYAYIKHFSTKTAEEYADKMLRGFPDGDYESYKKLWSEFIETRFFRVNKITNEKIDIFKNKLGVDMSYLLSGKSRETKIYSLCFDNKDFEFLDDFVVTPLQVGANVSHKDVCELKDNTGDNISSKNYFYIENTGIYWIWKNVHDCKYKGQMQYRRPLKGVNKDMDFDKIFKKYDVITCKPFNHPKDGLPTKENNFMSLPAKTVAEGYAFSNCMADLSVVESIINEYYPEYVSDYEKYIIRGENLYYSNGFILREHDYDEYCKFLFDILDKFLTKCGIEDKCDLYLHVGFNIGRGLYIRYKNGGVIPKKAIEWQSEIGGFLSERIWTLWLLHNFDKRKIYELPYVKQENNMYT